MTRKNLLFHWHPILTGDNAGSSSKFFHQKLVLSQDEEDDDDRELQKKVYDIFFVIDATIDQSIEVVGILWAMMIEYFKSEALHGVSPRSTKGEVSLYHSPPVWLVWNQLYDYW